MPKTEGGYTQLLERIEETFNIEEMTPENLTALLGTPTSGRIGLAQELSQISILNNEIDISSDISELNQLKREALRQPIFRFKLINKIDEKIEFLEIERKERQIAESFFKVSSFAQEKRVTLSDQIVGRQENWKGKDILTIRNSKGQFISWKKL